MNLGLQRPDISHLQDEIRGHLHSRQKLYIPGTLLATEEKSESNRAKLADWIFQLVDRFRFRTETAFLAVNIVDRVLGLKPVLTEKLALLGVTALVMASKY